MSWPPDVRVVDYGIRGLDLAYALADATGATILIDACSRGGPPGTVFVLADLDGTTLDHQPAVLDAHSMNPMRVIQMATAMGSGPEADAVGRV